MTVVLDSSIAIAAMNRVAAVVERLAKIPVDDVAIPMAAIAELAYGARRAHCVDQNRARLGPSARSLRRCRCATPSPTDTARFARIFKAAA